MNGRQRNTLDLNSQPPEARRTNFVLAWVAAQSVIDVRGGSKPVERWVPGKYVFKGSSNAQSDDKEHR
jgi:hypothetical protein